MNKLIFAVVFIYAAQSTFAQNGYRDGYVITNANDTLFGLIAYQEITKAQKSCDFRESKRVMSKIYIC